MTKNRKRLQDKLRRKYKWHSEKAYAWDDCSFLYKYVDGGWVSKHPELGRATITIEAITDKFLNKGYGGVHIRLTEEFCESSNTSFDRSIGITLSFEELESLYLISKEVHEKWRES